MLSLDRPLSFKDELAKRSAVVAGTIREFIREASGFAACEHLREGASLYFSRSSKMLRPALLLFSCGAVGGREETGLSAAAAVEMFHTWTLVHDDLIDEDNTRRGGPTVHFEMTGKAHMTMGYPPREAERYGSTIAILSGDLIHGWCAACLADGVRMGIPAEVALSLIQRLDREVLGGLLAGETLDVQFERRSIEELEIEEVLEMLRLKTGILCGFAARAGAMIGLGKPDDILADSLALFAERCGTAFQLQDDILGIVGDQKKLGKPVGSDIREGKRTPLLCFAWEKASKAQRELLASTLGDSHATPEAVRKATEAIVDTGALKRTETLARTLIEESRESLHRVPASEYRDILEKWADYMVERTM